VALRDGTPASIPALGFVRLPAPVVAALGAIALLYVGSAELAKGWFYRRP
jgi:hypothetical protein